MVNKSTYAIVAGIEDKSGSNTMVLENATVTTNDDGSVTVTCKSPSYFFSTDEAMKYFKQIGLYYNNK